MVPTVGLEGPSSHESCHYTDPFGEFKCLLCKKPFHKVKNYYSHLKICFEKKSSFSITEELVEDPQTSIFMDFEEHVSNSKNSIDQQQFNVPNEEQQEASRSTDPLQNLKSDNFSEESIDSVALKFSLSLHSQPNFTRKDVFKIQNFVTDEVLKEVFDVINSKISNCNCETKADIKQFTDMVIQSFKNISTEYKLEKELERLNLMEKPTEMVINREVGITYENRRAKFGVNVTKGYLLPLRFQIHEFLKRNKRIEEMIANNEKYSKPSECINHFVQGTTWKNMLDTVQLNDKKSLFLPIGLYSDGLQYNNNKGAHKDSVDHFHYFFPLLEDPLNIKNTHLAVSVRSNYIKSLEMENAFRN
uniref:Uncharacterized protein n=1 Tax=Megaselia scalaris TaxID=36166 RepID=T1GHB0_MEGSC